jgi:hypothetical protein
MPCALAASVGEGGNNTAPAVSRESLLRFQESFPMRKTTKRGTAKRNPQTCNLSQWEGRDPAQTYPHSRTRFF